MSLLSDITRLSSVFIVLEHGFWPREALQLQAQHLQAEQCIAPSNFHVVCLQIAPKYTKMTYYWVTTVNRSQDSCAMQFFDTNLCPTSKQPRSLIGACTLAGSIVEIQAFDSIAVLEAQDRLWPSERLKIQHT